VPPSRFKAENSILIYPRRDGTFNRKTIRFRRDTPPGVIKYPAENILGI